MTSRKAPDLRRNEISKRDLRGFSKATQRVLFYIVNDCGVAWRKIDGVHLVLYPPDGESRPFKVSAGRPDRWNMQILHIQFIQAYGIPPMPGGPYDEGGS